MLLIAPPHIVKAKPVFWYEFSGNAVEKSKYLGREYRLGLFKA